MPPIQKSLLCGWHNAQGSVHFEEADASAQGFCLLRLVGSGNRLSFAEASAAKAGGLEKTAHLKVIDPLFAEGEMSNNLFVAETPRETIQELFLTTSQS